MAGVRRWRRSRLKRLYDLKRHLNGGWHDANSARALIIKPLEANLAKRRVFGGRERIAGIADVPGIRLAGGGAYSRDRRRAAADAEISLTKCSGAFENGRRRV